MYLVIKELKPDTDCVIIVTSTLTKVKYTRAKWFSSQVWDE